MMDQPMEFLMFILIMKIPSNVYLSVSLTIRIILINILWEKKIKVKQYMV